MFFILTLLICIGAIVAWFSARRKVVQERNPLYSRTAGIAGGVAAVFALISIAQTFTVIPAGHVGVVNFFGIVKSETLPAGINFVNPLARIITFSVQTQELKENMQVLSREGLTIGLEISALYRLNPDSAARVYQTISGGDYENIVLVPQFRSICRSVTASFQASALYSSEREQLSLNIQKELSSMVSPRGIIVESTPLRNVALPQQLTEAIEQKQRADQESQRMEFILTKEKQEADRKRIEAQGIADFQKIVSSGLNDLLLQWKGVEATEKLASSQNAKVVIIGSGKNGLPVILDTK
jgi:prohibitin 1